MTLKNSIGVRLLLAVSLLSAGAATAQERSRTTAAKPDLKPMLDRMEKAADEFEDKFDAALDNSDVNGSTLERRLNDMADTMEDAIDNMAKYHNETDPQRFIDSLENALIAASGVNRFMLRRDMTAVTEEWDRLRSDLNTAAKAYHRPVLPNITVATLIPATAAMMSKQELQLAMERVEAAADRFDDKFENSLQHSTANLTDREDMFRSWGSALEDATDELVEQFKEKDHNDFARRLEETLVVADVVNRIMLRSDLFKDAELQWKELREDLNKVAVVLGHPVLPNTVVTERAEAR